MPIIGQCPSIYASRIMPSDRFDSDRITILFKAQETVLSHLACSFDLTTEVKAKTAKIIMHIGRKKLLTGGLFDAGEIAMDALFVLMTVSAPSQQSAAYPN